MASVPTEIAALLHVARRLVEHDQPDVDAMLELLDTLPLYDFDMPTCVAIAHARRATVASLGGNAVHAITAQCALARVVALLERRIAVTVALL